MTGDRKELSRVRELAEWQKGAYDRKVAASDPENPVVSATLKHILQLPGDLPEDDIEDPTEGWEPVPLTLDQLKDWLSSIDRRYDSVPWLTRRFWIVEWLSEAKESFGRFKCLDDLSSALLSVDKRAAELHPLLQSSASRAGRPRLKTAEFENRCVAALAIDALKAARLSTERAAKEVAVWLQKNGMRIRRSEYSINPVEPWETVKHWREEAARIARGKGRHRAGIRRIAASYLSQRDRLPKMMAARGADPRKVAMAFLKELRPLS
jgi:hypothetical protein